MRKLVRDWIRLLADTVPIPEPIVEFGSFQVEGMREVADLRPLFPGKRYLGTDLRAGPGVECLLDLHQVGLLDEAAGAILVLDTLEHVEFPRRAMEQIARALKPQGVFAISSVMDFPIHQHPCDFWRFTPMGFESLLRIFPTCLVFALGREDFPHTVLGLAWKSPQESDVVAAVRRTMDPWSREWERRVRDDERRQRRKRLVPAPVRNTWRRLRQR
jgi:SAM-dependent methyltransferase